MSALKNFKFNEDEDGELPRLVTGEEDNLNELLDRVKTDGGINMVSDNKVAKVNFQQQNESQHVSECVNKIPVTIITGYLGSGKSTMLEVIAMKGSDKKIAVILNEFGESSEIEKAMTIRNGSATYEEWLDLGNGCLCCSLQNIGVKAIENMITRSPGKIDYILLETSGIADPAPIAKMFWQDEGLNSSVYIDGIITVLDSEHIIRCLDDRPKSDSKEKSNAFENDLTIAHYQLAMADRIILNKFDKVEHDPEKIEELKNKVHSINAEAPLLCTKFGDVALKDVLNLHAFDVEGSKQLSKTFKPTIHDPRMTTITINFRPFKNQQEYNDFIKLFLQPLLWKSFGASQEYKFKSKTMKENNWEVQRTKGLLLTRNDLHESTDVKVLQGVRETYDIFPGALSTGTDTCKLVLIGKYLDEEDLQEFLYSIM